MSARHFPPSRPCTAPHRQRGVVLVISLIVLVALTLAGIALVRSTDTANVIAGNMAFRMGALQAVDTGVESAFTATTSDTGFFAAPNVATTTVAGQYFPIINDANSDGLPDVDWSTVPGTVVQDNTVRWVVERLCSINVAGNQAEQIAESCAVVPGPYNGSQRGGAAVRNPTQNTTYRATVRVEGPRNTLVIGQAIVAR